MRAVRALRDILCVCVDSTNWCMKPSAMASFSKVWLPLSVSLVALVWAILSFQQENRAWIAPTRAVLDGDLRLDSPIILRVHFKNTGRQPALDMVHLWRHSILFEVMPDAANIPYIEPDKIEWPSFSPCDAEARLGSAIGRPIHASGQEYGDLRYAFGSGIPSELLEKRATFLVLGCFTYETSGLFGRRSERKSSYCFYFQPYRDRDTQESTFEPCVRTPGTAT